METQIHMIFIKNGQTLENIISESQYLKQNGNTISRSEIMNVNVFLTISPLISIINNSPLICQ